MRNEELKTYNGADGKPAYIAYKGKIYDVSKSKLWMKGVHMANHRAGGDLTEQIKAAPHGEEVLSRVQEIGILEEEPESVDYRQNLRVLYRKFHPHPILIHYPMGLYVFSALMQFLYFVTRIDTFEVSAFYGIVFATVTAVPTMAAGFFSWWLNYESTFTVIFKNKIIFSFVLLAMGIFMCVARYADPGISSRMDLLSLTYNGSVFLAVPVIGFVAYNGGKITWPS